MARKPKPIAGQIRIKKPGRGVIWARRSALSVALSGMATYVLYAALTLAGIPILPMIWYRIQPGTSAALAQVLQRPVTNTFEQALIEEGVKEEEPWQPSIDESLPELSRIRIETIGVDSEIYEESLTDYEIALQKGVWRVPDFGTPYNRQRPLILAAHRFGYLSWSNAYRRVNSFFNLPKLEAGDRVEVIWQQRKYVYEVYAGDEGEVISDYTADLILYTCELLTSDVRIFRYARLLEE